MKQAFEAYSKRVGIVPVPDDYDVFEMLIGAPRSRSDSSGGRDR